MFLSVFQARFGPPNILTSMGEGATIVADKTKEDEMAIRNTEKEIRELLAQVQAKYPQARFEIEKHVVLEGTDREFTQWILCEVRRCPRCGREVSTGSVGAQYPIFCHDCFLAEAAEAAARSEAAIAANARKVAWGVFHDSVLG